MTTDAVSLAVHGGAGKWRKDKQADALEGIDEVVREGIDLLESGKSALDVVELVVGLLEDNSTFNAGTGSSLNLDGEVEMDASIMDGSRRMIGAVTALPDVKNPIRVARKVMEETDHVMLSGDGALRFARAMGFESHDCRTDESVKQFEKKKDNIKTKEKRYTFPRLPELLEEYPELEKGTVGAVARDGHGHYAAATSTGGLIMQMAGRVGDTPLPGAGTYATGSAAASATGQGELVMRMLSTHRICQKINEGATAKTAIEESVSEMKETVGVEAGFIVVDANGDTHSFHDTDHMPHARYESGMDEPEVELTIESGILD